jgi:hypothetical protein
LKRGAGIAKTLRLLAAGGEDFRNRRKHLKDNAFEARVPNVRSAFGMRRAELRVSKGY